MHKAKVSAQCHQKTNQRKKGPVSHNKKQVSILKKYLIQHIPYWKTKSFHILPLFQVFRACVKNTSRPRHGGVHQESQHLEGWDRKIEGSRPAQQDPISEQHPRYRKCQKLNLLISENSWATQAPRIQQRALARDPASRVSVCWPFMSPTNKKH
jgi:hypothetical protein